MSISIKDGTEDIKKILHLRDREEIIGVFKGFVEVDYQVHIWFDNSQLIFNLETTEAKILKEKLEGVMVGEKISILKTDIPEKPIVVRIDEMDKNTTLSSSFNSVGGDDAD